MTSKDSNKAKNKTNRPNKLKKSLLKGGTDVAYGEGDIGEESFDITIPAKEGTGIKSYGNLGSSKKWDRL